MNKHQFEQIMLLSAIASSIILFRGYAHGSGIHFGLPGNTPIHISLGR